MKEQETARRLLNGREMKCIECLTAMDSRIIEAGESLKERLQLIPNGWRQWRLLASTLSKLLIQLYDTMPLKNLRHIRNICDYGEVLIRMRPAVRVPEYALINEDDLRMLINIAMAAECAVCLKTGKEIERCKLRRAMMSIAPPYEEQDMGCGFRDVAVDGKYGEYI